MQRNVIDGLGAKLEAVRGLHAKFHRVVAADATALTAGGADGTASALPDAIPTAELDEAAETWQGMPFSEVVRSAVISGKLSLVLAFVKRGGGVRCLFRLFYISAILYFGCFILRLFIFRLFIFRLFWRGH